jgi:hypothetical protein
MALVKKVTYLDPSVAEWIDVMAKHERRTVSQFMAKVLGEAAGRNGVVPLTPPRVNGAIAPVAARQAPLPSEVRQPEKASHESWSDRYDREVRQAKSVQPTELELRQLALVNSESFDTITVEQLRVQRDSLAEQFGADWPTDDAETGI